MVPIVAGAEASLVVCPRGGRDRGIIDAEWLVIQRIHVVRAAERLTAVPGDSACL